MKVVIVIIFGLIYFAYAFYPSDCNFNRYKYSNFSVLRTKNKIVGKRIKQYAVHCIKIAECICKYRNLTDSNKTIRKLSNLCDVLNVSSCKKNIKFLFGTDTITKNMNNISKHKIRAFIGDDNNVTLSTTIDGPELLGYGVIGNRNNNSIGVTILKEDFVTSDARMKRFLPKSESIIIDVKCADPTKNSIFQKICEFKLKHLHSTGRKSKWRKIELHELCCEYTMVRTCLKRIEDHCYAEEGTREKNSQILPYVDPVAWLNCTLMCFPRDVDWCSLTRTSMAGRPGSHAGTAISFLLLHKFALNDLLTRR